jgi:hypothetical protein
MQARSVGACERPRGGQVDSGISLMAGKPTIPPRVHAKIRKLDAQGVSRAAIAEMIPCSLYTVRKALDPDFAESERERQRGIDRSDRQENPDYLAYQAAFAATEARREQVRARMAALRAERRKV